MDIQETVNEYLEHRKLTRCEGRQGVENLCKLVRGLGYKDSQYFGQFAHDGSIGDLIEFLEDNPGCIVAIQEWIGDNGNDEWKERLEADLPLRCPHCGEEMAEDEDGVSGCSACGN